MIKKKLHIGGVELDLTLPKTEIEAKLNENQEKCYPGGLVVASYREIDSRTAEVVFTRELPNDYVSGLGPQTICHVDAAIITGLPEYCFKGDYLGEHKPVVAPLLPWYKAWYVPTPTLVSFIRAFNMTMCKEQISRVKIAVTTSDITVQIKYPRAKNRYEDDIADLEAELGGPLTNHRGETLQYTLCEIGQIIERTYIKKKAYMGLIGYLAKTYDITLEIK